MEESEKIYTCQICGRPVKAKKGLIAHHGYKRPGGGWQTSSCLGARFKPYEVSCDRLPYVIERIKEHISGTENVLKNTIENPPEKLTINTGGYYSKNTIDVFKPENFDAEHALKFGSYSYQTYESQFVSMVHNYQRTIKLAKADLEFMETRLKTGFHQNNFCCCGRVV